jgi:sulfatase maturation enzyme AslB (radical SAM superfamily)
MGVDFFPAVTTELLFTQRCNMACTYCFEPSKNKKKMTQQDMLDFVASIPSTGIMMFGGEPLLDLDLFTALYDAIEAKQMNEAQKQTLLQSFTVQTTLITNGLLVRKYVDVLKKYNIGVQISIDGPKELNDLHRIHPDGTGTYDEIMDAIQFCIDTGIRWGWHGAVGADGFPYMVDLFNFNWDLSKKLCTTNGILDVAKAIKMMGENNFQIIFEYEYTDKDIDVFLNAQGDVFSLTLTFEDPDISLTMNNRIALLQSWFERQGSACVAGNTLLAVDSNMDVFACHRPAMTSRKDEHKLGNLKDRSTFTGFKLFNNYTELDRRKYMYAAIQPNDGYKKSAPQQNWCPAANAETSDTVFYQSAKYNLMIAEYGRFVKEIFEYAGIPHRVLTN